MNNFELISEFLDGNLNTFDEERLFASLSSDADLRLELKQQMAIKNAILSDTMAYTPKSSSTIAIFDELGLILPAPVAIGLGTKLMNFMRTNASYIYTGLISSAIAVVITILLLNFNSGNSNSNFTKNGNQDKSKGIPIMSNFEGNSITKDSKIEENLNKDNLDKNLSSAKADNSEPKVVYKYIYVGDKKISDNKLASNNLIDNRLNASREFNENNLLNDENPNSSDLALQKIITSSELLRDFSDELNLQDFNRMRNFRALPSVDYNNNFSDFIIDLNDDFSFELHGASYQSESSVDLKRSDFSLLNTSATLLYNLNDEFKIGAEYRRERFYQQFTGSELGNMYSYEQEPNFETYSAVLRYNPSYFKFSKFSPFVSAYLGANPAGIVPRLSIGTDLYISSSIYFNFAYDYSILFYKQENANFISNKSGLQFGAGFNF